MKTGLLALLLVFASADLDALLEKIGGAKDPAARRDLVARVAARNTRRSVLALERLARLDPDVTVRVAAVRGIAGSKAENALERLGALLVHGGVRAVRRAVAEGIARRPGGPEALESALANPRNNDLTAGLLIQNLGLVPGPVALHRLLRIAAESDPHRRCAALRALAARKDGTDALVELVEALTKKHRDPATVMTILDLVEARPDLRFLPAVERAATFLEPAVKGAALHARGVLKYREALAKAEAMAKATAKEGYEFQPPDLPTEPPPRPRFDLVYGFDSTGSVTVHLDTIRSRIRDQHRFLVGLGSDVRVGIVVFRDHRNMGKYPVLQVQPLTHDMDDVVSFLDGIRAGGADTQGAAVSIGLHEGLDRMGWRVAARRTFTLIADSRLDDAAACRLTVSQHRAADGTRVRVLYLLRTRRSVPEDVTALAEAGGSVLEFIE